MIGVLFESRQRSAVREFFELFKVAWEEFRPTRTYSVVLTTTDVPSPASARLVVVFRGGVTEFDRRENTGATSSRAGGMVERRGQRLPIYGPFCTFRATERPAMTDPLLSAPASWCGGTSECRLVRVGYDLFDEVQQLLSGGQPAVHAHTPTLDLHVAFVRELILAAGVPLAEVPPAPAGHAFTACLTHDLDHPLLGNHRFDHTMFGFMHRATIGSLGHVMTGRRTLGQLWDNCLAVAQLPLVQLRLAPDPWRQFVRYAEWDEGNAGTYFVLPRRDHAGRAAEGDAPARRAARYEPADIAPELQTLRAGGAEVALHGIDAWLGAEDGRSETARLESAVGEQPRGVRMHWLYFGPHSVAALEAAGFQYDSSVGYNETVGYRSGTSQVYRPAGARSLLELPLHVMDTALFYPDHLGLSDAEAAARVAPLLAHAAQHGGVITINWHDRSIAPERHWGGFYLRLLASLRAQTPWFATARDAVAWFARRRDTAITSDPASSARLHVHVPPVENPAMPGLVLRVHRLRPGAPAGNFADAPDCTSTDLALPAVGTLSLQL